VTGNVYWKWFSWVTNDYTDWDFIFLISIHKTTKCLYKIIYFVKIQFYVICGGNRYLTTEHNIKDM